MSPNFSPGHLYRAKAGQTRTPLRGVSCPVPSGACRTRSDVSGHCPDLSGTTKDELGVVNDPRF